MTEPTTPRPRRLREWLLNLALILVIFLAVQWWMARPLATGAAPALNGRTLDGQAVDLKDLRGQPVLVHFWATWCPVCKLGNGAIAAIARDHRVISVAMQSGGAADIAGFMAAAGLRFPVLTDDDGAIASRWGVPGVPATFVIDADGQIAYSATGLSTETGLRARLWAAAPAD
jgi:peroxiredoxin